MKGIILSAGEGTRLRPLTNKTPKVMLPVNGKPLIDYNLELLRKNGIEIAVNVFHLKDKIKSHLENVTISEENELLGTAGGVKNIGDFFDDTFVVIYGDILTNIDLSKVIEFHKENKGIGTICLHKHKSKSSNVELDGDRIIKFEEHPEEEKEGWVNAGIYVLEKEVLDFINGKEDFSKDVFPRLIEKGLFGFKMDNYFWFEIGRPEKYEEINEKFKSGLVI